MGFFCTKPRLRPFSAAYIRMQTKCSLTWYARYGRNGTLSRTWRYHVNLILQFCFFDQTGCHFPDNGRIFLSHSFSVNLYLNTILGMWSLKIQCLCPCRVPPLNKIISKENGQNFMQMILPGTLSGTAWQTVYIVHVLKYELPEIGHEKNSGQWACQIEKSPVPVWGMPVLPVSAFQYSKTPDTPCLPPYASLDLPAPCLQ